MPLAIADVHLARVQFATISDYHFTFVTFTLPTAAIAVHPPG
jgi:cytochrome bd-type quinol oxidase subunit 1